MGTLRKLTDITAIVIHCADTPNGRADTVEDINRWHGERQPPFTRDMSIAPKHLPGLTHIGYHFVIEVDGKIRPGRPLQETGAHVSGFNANSVGICLIGRDKFSAEQWHALHELVANLITQIPTCTKVFGHRDLNPGKNCPGFSVADWIHNDYIPDFNHMLDAEVSHG